MEKKAVARIYCHGFYGNSDHLMYVRTAGRYGYLLRDRGSSDARGDSPSRRC